MPKDAAIAIEMFPPGIKPVSYVPSTSYSLERSYLHRTKGLNYKERGHATPIVIIDGEIKSVTKIVSQNLGLLVYWGY